MLNSIAMVDLDRTNLGNARLQGLPQDVLGGDPTGVLFDWANSAFFFTYVGLLITHYDMREFSNSRRMRSDPVPYSCHYLVQTLPAPTLDW